MRKNGYPQDRQVRARRPRSESHAQPMDIADAFAQFTAAQVKTNEMLADILTQFKAGGTESKKGGEGKELALSGL